MGLEAGEISGDEDAGEAGVAAMHAHVARADPEASGEFQHGIGGHEQARRDVGQGQRVMLAGAGGAVRGRGHRLASQTPAEASRPAARPTTSQYVGVTEWAPAGGRGRAPGQLFALGVGQLGVLVVDLIAGGAIGRLEGSGRLEAGLAVGVARRVSRERDSSKRGRGREQRLTTHRRRVAKTSRPALPRQRS